MNKTQIILYNCLYLPEFNINILLVKQLIDRDFIINFVKNKAIITGRNL